jgi:intracellular sulfur oxidation DsrE/DsrF family protein
MNRSILLRALIILPALTAATRLGAGKRAAHRVVVEVTSGDPETWESALNNVRNFQKELAPERTEVEVVAHGKGLPMLLKTNTAGAGSIEQAAGSGVRLVACENTMRRLGVERPELLPAAGTTPSGVAEVIRKQEAGWSYLRIV